VMEKDKQSKIKSFNDYANQVRTEKLVQKAYTDHLLQQLAEAKHSPVQENKAVLDKINELSSTLEPVSRFFSLDIKEIQPVKKRVSKAERLAIEEAEKKARLDAHMKM